MTTKTEAASEARKALQAVKDFLTQSGSEKANEATTRAHFLNPLLVALGYESIQDVLYEYYLPDGKQFLDYRLVINGKPSVSVEAKALGIGLTDKHAAQVVSYASILGDEWAVLTNAREWRLYNAFAQVPLGDKLVFTVDLVDWQSDAQFDAVFEQLWLLSRESLASGDGPSSWLKAKQLDRVLRSALTNPSSAEVKYIKKRLDGKGLKVSAEQVAGWLQTKIDAKPAPSATPATGSPRVAPPKTKKAGAKATPKTGGTGLWLIPAGPQAGYGADEHLRNWLDKGFWGFGEKTPGRVGIAAGDRVVFYAAKKNLVMARARISAPAVELVGQEEWPGPDAYSPGTYRLPLEDIVWLDPPIRLDADCRATLEAFQGRDVNGIWSWYVQTSRRITPADYVTLTGGHPGE